MCRGVPRAARATKLLRRSQDDGDASTTDDDDDDEHHAAVKRHWRAAAEAVIFATHPKSPGAKPEKNAPASKAKAKARWGALRDEARAVGPKARAAVACQAAWRGAVLRTRWRREDAALLLQAVARGANERSRVQNDEAAALLQALFRGVKSRVDAPPKAPRLQGI